VIHHRHLGDFFEKHQLRHMLDRLKRRKRLKSGTHEFMNRSFSKLFLQNFGEFDVAREADLFGLAVQLIQKFCFEQHATII